MTTTSNDAGGAAVRATVRVPVRLDGLAVDGDVFTFEGLRDRAEHIAIGLGPYRDVDVPLVRLHSECLTGDVFGSARCDCGPQLHEAITRIATAGGYLLYLRQEGRGIGLYRKFDAYALQDQGLDTREANLALGEPADGRDYGVATQMLHALGVRTLDLLTNNPDKVAQVEAGGIEVRRRASTGTFENPHNERYLRTKNRSMGHLIELPTP